MNFQNKLLGWFRKNARPLPWREKYRPYEVWVSEIMLQQTQVETVLPYYQRWLKAFPTVEVLAQSGEKKVLKLWEGLGYYSRARNLHHSAKLIMKKYGGVFPQDHEAIRSLKGIGRYTAGAIASIAFNQEKPIVDGNVLRVLSRVYAIRKPIDAEKNKERFWQLEESLIPKGRARFFNQALMELGALVCHTQNPLCGACPINNFCVAFKKKETDRYPVRNKRKKIIKVEASALVLSREGRYLIRRRPVGKIMGGLWEFPEWKLSRETKLSLDQIKRKTCRLAQREFSLKIDSLSHLDTVKRNYTHYNETLQVFGAELSENGILKKSKTDWPFVWISKNEFEKYPFSSAHSKIAALIISSSSCKSQRV